jgi:redox-sensitive bicupin YhaK (pirin superfamily)
VWAGSLDGKTGLPPPPDSYASNPNGEVAIWFVELAPGGRYTLPPAAGGAAINRVLYFTEGEGLNINAQKIKTKSAVTLLADQEAVVENTHPTETTELLILQGRPIGEPVAQHGPFVMNTKEEIQQAFADYRATQFGGWPWPEDAMVFPREKGRFSLLGGVETTPPGSKMGISGSV